MFWKKTLNLLLDLMSMVNLLIVISEFILTMSLRSIHKINK